MKNSLHKIFYNSTLVFIGLTLLVGYLLLSDIWDLLSFETKIIIFIVVLGTGMLFAYLARIQYVKMLLKGKRL